MVDIQFTTEQGFQIKSPFVYITLNNQTNLRRNIMLPTSSKPGQTQSVRSEALEASWGKRKISFKKCNYEYIL